MKKLSQVVHAPNSQFQHLVQHSQAVQQLEQQLVACLPQPLRAQCHVANVTEDSVVIYAHSAVWATRLRYLQAELLAHAQQCTGLPLTRVIVKVQPSSGAVVKPPPATAAPRTLSADNASLLRAVAENMSHRQLRHALLRLIQHQTTEAGCK